MYSFFSRKSLNKFLKIINYRLEYNLNIKENI